MQKSHYKNSACVAVTTGECVHSRWLCFAVLLSLALRRLGRLSMPKFLSKLRENLSLPFSLFFFFFLLVCLGSVFSQNRALESLPKVEIIGCFLVEIWMPFPLCRALFRVRKSPLFDPHFPHLKSPKIAGKSSWNWLWRSLWRLGHERDLFLYWE